MITFEIKTYNFSRQLLHD